MILLKYYELELDGEPLLQYAFKLWKSNRRRTGPAAGLLQLTAIGRAVLPVS